MVQSHVDAIVSQIDVRWHHVEADLCCNRCKLVDVSKQNFEFSTFELCFLHLNFVFYTLNFVFCLVKYH